MLTKPKWPEITIGSREENLNQLYQMVVHGRNFELLGLACRIFVKRKGKSPFTIALLKLAAENQEFLSEEEKAEVWSDILEKFSPGIAYQLAKKNLKSEWREDFYESLFHQNGRVYFPPGERSLEKKLDPKAKLRGSSPSLPEWMLRSPFGIAKEIQLNPGATGPVIQILKDRIPESYPAHTVLFVYSFLVRDRETFLNHYSRSGRMKFHPQSIYMRAILEIRSGKDEMGAQLLGLIRTQDPNWEVPRFLQSGG